MTADRIDRRSMLGALAGGLGLVGTGGAVYNSVLGYGTLGIGTNLHDQAKDGSLATLATRSVRITRSPTYLRTDAGRIGIEATTRGYRIEFPDGSTTQLDHPLPPEMLAEDDRFEPISDSVRAIDRDRMAIESGQVSVEFSDVESFFDRVRQANPRPLTVEMLRGRFPARPDPALVRQFTGVDPASVERLVHGLADGFREHTYYDIPRFTGGAIQDNLTGGRMDLRGPFESDIDFATLLESDSTGVFCGELTVQSMAAFHAVAPIEQSVPVVTAYVVNDRHKHIYTGIASLVRDATGTLLMPMTFVDYTFPTLFDDLGIDRIVASQIDAFDTRHRADDIRWHASSRD